MKVKKDLRKKLTTIASNPRHQMTLILNGGYPKVPKFHCVVKSKYSQDCYWVFPEIRNDRQRRRIDMALLKRDLKAGRLKPILVSELSDED
jgi:hypothetical protein